MATDFKGSFVPTTNIWDVGAIQEVDVNSPEFKELLVRLYQNINLIAIQLNGKDAGYYVLGEFINGQSYFPNPTTAAANPTIPVVLRPVYRLTLDFGALPNTGTKSVAHGIVVDNNTTFTRIYATASDTTGHTYIPIPYISATENREVEITVDATNVNITTSANLSNFNQCYVVLEYMKQ